MKRLLCLISGMEAGGAETFLMKIYRALDRDKYQMDFGVYVDRKCFYDDEIASMGGKIFHLVPKTKNFTEYKRSLYDLVKNEHYEHVLRITSNAAGFYDLKIAKEAGAKVCIARSSNSSDGGGWKVNLVNYISRFLYMKYVDVKIAPSDLAAEYTFGKKAVRNNEVHYLKNGLDLNLYRYSEENRSKIRREFDIENKFVVGHIGRFSKQKNHSFLVDIFHEVLKHNDNSVLLLVGKGELEDSIRKKVQKLGIEDKVIFAGVRSDIPAMLSAMDVLVFPSLYEGMPNTVIEAQATGLRCIISDKISRQSKICCEVEFVGLDNFSKWVAKTTVINNTDRKLLNYSDLFSSYNIDRCVERFIEMTIL